MRRTAGIAKGLMVVQSRDRHPPSAQMESQYTGAALTELSQLEQNITESAQNTTSKLDREFPHTTVG